jgi:hypothetical protein
MFDFTQKIDRATFWAIFSQTHQVALLFRRQADQSGHELAEAKPVLIGQIFCKLQSSKKEANLSFETFFEQLILDFFSFSVVWYKHKICQIANYLNNIHDSCPGGVV